MKHFMYKNSFLCTSVCLFAADVIFSGRIDSCIRGETPNYKMVVRNDF